MPPRAKSRRKVVADATTSAGGSAAADTARPRKRRGRPLTVDADKIAKFLGALRGGNSRPTAAIYAGLKVPTVYRWLSDARPEFADLQASVEQAEAHARVTVNSRLFALTARSPRAAQLWLRVHGGPEWRGGDPNSKGKSGADYGRDNLRRAARDAIERSAMLQAREAETATAPSPPFQDERDTHRVYFSSFDPIDVVPEYATLPEEWRWPIRRMLAAAAKGDTPTTFFKRIRGVGPGLREDAEPPPEWWQLPDDPPT